LYFQQTKLQINNFEYIIFQTTLYFLNNLVSKKL
jgi:hypothetical protein